MNKLLVLSASAALISSPAIAQVAAPDQIVSAYAQQSGISQQEAQARLGRLSEINTIEKALLERFPNQFGGLYVQHEPEFRVVVKMTGAGAGLLQQITTDPSYIVEKATTPIKLLMQLKDRVDKKLVTDGSYFFATEVNIWDGVVEIRSTDIDAVRSALPQDLQANRNLKLVAVASGMENTATIYGGRQLTGAQYCTSGFTVTSDGGPGIITAGHCDDRMTLSGVTFDVVQRVYKDSTTWGFDVQFMRPSSSHTYPNQAYQSSSSRQDITSKYYAADIPLDWPLCAYGTTTNSLRCGKLKGKFVTLRDNKGITGTFFRAAPDDGNAFVTEGDSGGPVFGANVAYGLIKGKGSSTYATHMYFMDIQTLEAAGGLNYNVRVKITP